MLHRIMRQEDMRITAYSNLIAQQQTRTRDAIASLTASLEKVELQFMHAMIRSVSLCCHKALHAGMMAAADDFPPLANGTTWDVQKL